MKQTLLHLIIASFALGPAGAAVLVFDDFAGSATALNGKVSDTGGLAWTAGSYFLANGAVGNGGVNSGSGNGQSAYLGYDIVAGVSYELTAVFTSGSATESNDWISFGFSTITQNSTLTDANIRHTAGGSYGWLLARNSSNTDIEIYNGPNNTNAATTISGLTVYTHTYKIGLNLTGTNAVITYTLDGNPLTTAASTATSANVATALTGIGFTRTGGATGSLNSITLSSVPEPSAALLGAVGSLCMLRRRRA